MAVALRSKNLLIAHLADADYEMFEPHLERVPLKAGEVIARSGDPIEQLCFPEDAVVSIATSFDDGSLVQVGVVGICGMVGWPSLLGVREHAQRAKVEVGGGSALRIKADDFADCCARSPAAVELFRRFVHLFGFQVTTAAASNLRDSAETRLARWLLMCHDRLDGDEIVISQQHIGTMLGVRRATVTDTLHVLEGRRTIRSRRGRVWVLDRDGLEGVAGEAYGKAEALYRRLVAPFGKGRAAMDRPLTPGQRVRSE